MRHGYRIWAGVAAVLLAASGASAQEEKDGWVKHSAADGAFTVSFPGKPKVTEKKGSSLATVKDVRAEAKKDGVEFTAGFLQYSEMFAEKFDALDPADFAKRQREGTVKRTKGKVLTEKDITVGGGKRPGFELVIEVGPKAFIRQRTVYSKGRLYQLLVTGETREAVTGAAAERFIDSFRLPE